jgi:GT2 family glycosyltransferase
MSVVIATRGRGDFLIHILRLLENMERPPNIVCISGGDASDVGAAVRESTLPITVVFGPAGLSAQRNTGVRAIREQSDIVIFFDDDFFPSRTWLTRLETVFVQHPTVLGVGGITLADGARTIGVPVKEALKMIDEFDNQYGVLVNRTIKQADSLYGCNMAFKSEVFDTNVFDENLHLYGWLEDKDFSRRVSKVGKIIRVSDLIGVHLGLKSGRMPGKKLGMAQIINPIYLWKKGTLSLTEACINIIRALAANLIKSVWPEHYIDRRGRLSGNVRGLGQLFSGKIDPTIIGME